MNDEHNNQSEEEVQKATSFRRSVKRNAAPNGQGLIYNPSRRNAGLGLVAPQNILNDADDDDDDLEEKATSEETPEDENSKEEESTNQGQTGENVPNPNLNQKERTKVKGNAIMSALTFIKNFKRNLIIAGIVFGAVLIVFLFILVGSFGAAEEENQNSYCSAGTEGDVISFLDNWEGKSNALTCNNGTGYAGQNIGDGTVTIGSGVTNYVIRSDYMASYIRENGWQNYFLPYGSNYQISVGTCIPKEIVEKLKLRAIEVAFAAPIDTYAAKYNVELTQYQKDALTVFNYNLGAGHTESLIRAYATGGYEGLWNAMKGYTCATLNGVYQCNHIGLMRRRKAEFALFVTGDYSDQGKFYSRNVNNYDDYDSEGVMSRQLVCSDYDSGDFIVPLEGSYRCSSSFGPRKPPTAGASSDHGGIDLGAQCSMPIHASRSGTVSIIRQDKTGGGNWIQIEHGDGLATRYLHMSRFADSLSVNQQVSQGEVIGYVGTTGTSTGCHLDFRVLVNGTPQDPFKYIGDKLKPYDNNMYRCQHNY